MRTPLILLFRWHHGNCFSCTPRIDLELSIPVVDRDAIVTWVRKKTGVPVIRLQSQDSAKEFLKKDQTFVIGLFKNFEVREMLDVNTFSCFALLQSLKLVE